MNPAIHLSTHLNLLHQEVKLYFFPLIIPQRGRNITLPLLRRMSFRSIREWGRVHLSCYMLVSLIPPVRWQPRLEWQQTYTAAASTYKPLWTQLLFNSRLIFLFLNLTASTTSTSLCPPFFNTHTQKKGNTTSVGVVAGPRSPDLQPVLAGGPGSAASSTFIGFLLLLLQCGLQQE